MRKRGGGNCEGTGAEVHRGGPKSFIQLRETVGGRRACRIRPFPKRSAGPCARRGPARSNRIPHREHEQILPSAWRGQRTSMTRQTQKTSIRAMHARVLVFLTKTYTHENSCMGLGEDAQKTKSFVISRPGVAVQICLVRLYADVFCVGLASWTH